MEQFFRRRRVGNGDARRRGESHGEDNDDLRSGIPPSRGSRFSLFSNFLGLNLAGKGRKPVSGRRVVHPDNRWYKAWTVFILVWALYSSFFTPLEFAFFRGLPENLFLLDIAVQLAFLVDVFLRFFVAYGDTRTYRTVYRRSSTAIRYLKSSFAIDLLACMPWDTIYKATGRKEEVRYLLWVRLYRAKKLVEFCHNMEMDIRISYLFTRIAKLLLVEFYCIHTAASIFYFLATALREGSAWIRSLKMGDISYSTFIDTDIWTRYTASMYFAIATMAAVGNGDDTYAVNVQEMTFIMVYTAFGLILGIYFIGNVISLIVRGSNAEKSGVKMADIMKYMNRNKLGIGIRDEISSHLRLQYETEAAALKDIPNSIRAKIAQAVYMPHIEKTPLFNGCSPEFVNQIVTRLHEEFLLPGEVILEEGSVVDQLYLVCDGVLEEIGAAKDGSEETVSLLQPDSSFGEISILCNIPQPYTVRVSELCRLLRLDKQSLTNILEIYFHDGRKFLNNLLEGKESNVRTKQLESAVAYHIGKQEAELALKVNSAAYHGDLYQLKSLIRAGADPNKTDYAGRSPLHLAGSKGHEDVTLYLILEGADVNFKDKMGNTPLLEAIKNGNDRVACLLAKEGASLDMENAGTFLCTVVARGDGDYLKRLLENGIDPNSKDYDHRTPLHIAASQGMYLMAKQLVEAGASVLAKDRWGNTPLDEATACGNKNLIKLLEDTKACQVSSSCPSSSKDEIQRKK